jgi:hypothetical protein
MQFESSVADLLVEGSFRLKQYFLRLLRNGLSDLRCCLRLLQEDPISEMISAAGRIGCNYELTEVPSEKCNTNSSWRISL